MDLVIFEENKPFVLEALQNGEFDYMEAAVIGEFRSWSSCTVSLSVVANREHYGDGHQEIWFLIDTRKVNNPDRTRQEYHLRVSTEERYRQLKCFNDLTHFTSRAFPMVVNQVVFIMLAYNLLQIYLLHRGRKELNQKTQPRYPYVLTCFPKEVSCEQSSVFSMG
jgi:hypothetical protein